jgi:hypothetical protein
MIISQNSGYREETFSTPVTLTGMGAVTTQVYIYAFNLNNTLGVLNYINVESSATPTALILNVITI